MLLKIITAYLLLINISGFFICLADKRKAIKKRWRIPERNIFAVAAAGGSIGVYLSLILFRHKTRHLRFMAGIPAIFIIQAGIVVFLVMRGYLHIPFTGGGSI